MMILTGTRKNLQMSLGLSSSTFIGSLSFETNRTPRIEETNRAVGG